MRVRRFVVPEAQPDRATIPKESIERQDVNTDDMA